MTQRWGFPLWLQLLRVQGSLVQFSVGMVMGIDNWTVLVSQGCCNKVLQTGAFKLKKPILSQFWRLESESRASAGPRSPKGSRGKSSLASSNFWWLCILGWWPSHASLSLSSPAPAPPSCVFQASVSDNLLELGPTWIL